MTHLRCAFATIVMLTLSLIGAPLSADELRPAVIELTERNAGEWTLEWKLPVAAGAGGASVALADPVIPKKCVFAAEPVRRAAPLALLGSAQLRCEADLAGAQFGLSELTGRADAIARFVPLDRPAQTFRLTAGAPTATIKAQPDRWAVAADYFVIGAEHILLGWDHLLFVIALALLVRRSWAVVKAATAFTIAHSITLAATTLGYTGLPGRPVEALIALSIVFLAVELVRAIRQPENLTWTRRAPWLVAFVFGLLHGFGFAGALADIGLPQTEIASALIAFNLGVEAGQVAVIAVLLTVVAGVSRIAPKAETPAIRIIAYGIGITGSFWLVERIVG